MLANELSFIVPTLFWLTNISSICNASIVNDGMAQRKRRDAKQQPCNNNYSSLISYTWQYEITTYHMRHETKYRRCLRIAVARSISWPSNCIHGLQPSDQVYCLSVCPMWQQWINIRLMVPVASESLRPRRSWNSSNSSKILSITYLKFKISVCLTLKWVCSCTKLINTDITVVCITPPYQ